MCERIKGVMHCLAWSPGRGEYLTPSRKGHCNYSDECSAAEGGCVCDCGKCTKAKNQRRSRQA